MASGLSLLVAVSEPACAPHCKVGVAESVCCSKCSPDLWGTELTIAKYNTCQWKSS